MDLLNEKKTKISEEEYPFNQYFYYSDYINDNYLHKYINNKEYPVLSKYLELKNNDNILNDFYTYSRALNLLNEQYSTKTTREYASKTTLGEELIYKENKDLYTKFFDIFYKLSDDDNYNDEEEENENNLNMNLNPTLPLFNYFIIEENKFSEKYKYIYKKFIDKQNEIVLELLKAKQNSFEEQNKYKINIQNIIKEDEIFTVNKDFSILSVLFNCSYRKECINDNLLEFNAYEINYDYIEEIMTDKLFKNKKLINEDIFEFKYKNEDIDFKNKDICTKFKESIHEEVLTINDQIIFYEYFEENKGNVNLHQKLLDDFSQLIHYFNEKEQKEEIPQIKIYKFVEKLEFVSNDFKEIFKDKNNLTVNKLLNIYEYYQILCFNKIKEQLKQYQEKIIDEG